MYGVNLDGRTAGLIFGSVDEDWTTWVSRDGSTFYMMRRRTGECFYLYHDRPGGSLLALGRDGIRLGDFEADSWLCGKLLSMFPEEVWGVLRRTVVKDA